MATPRSRGINRNHFPPSHTWFFRPPAHGESKTSPIRMIGLSRIFRPATERPSGLFPWTATPMTPSSTHAVCSETWEKRCVKGVWLPTKPSPETAERRSPGTRSPSCDRLSRYRDRPPCRPPDVRQLALLRDRCRRGRGAGADRHRTGAQPRQGRAQHVIDSADRLRPNVAGERPGPTRRSRRPPPVSCTAEWEAIHRWNAIAPSHRPACQSIRATSPQVPGARSTE